jgi:hypothetical protein
MIVGKMGHLRPKLTLTLSDDVQEMYGGLRRSIKLSRLVRCLIVAMATSDEEWKKRLEQDRELRASREWIRDNVVRRFLK